MPPKFKFAEGEKVLCFHGPMLYEAKCVKAEQTNKLVKYLVHYLGWNKSWDEWVPEDRVLKPNEQNMKKMKDLQTQRELQNKRSRARKSLGKGKDGSDRDTSSPLPDLGGPATTGGKTKPVETTPPGSTTSSTTTTPKPRKRSRQDDKEEREDRQKVQVNLTIPEELKQWLVDDWDFVTRQKKLVEIPAKITVDQILENYLAFRKADYDPDEGPIDELANGVREYFNVMLGCQLLYKFERAQYHKIYKEHENEPLSKFYGAHHLARLFVKLGQALSYSSLSKNDVDVLVPQLHDFMSWLIKQQLITPEDYTTASAEYLRKSMG